MKTQIDYIKSKDIKKNEYIVYPKTLMQCVVDDGETTLQDILTNIDVEVEEKLNPKLVSETGYNGFRFYNNKFQYYNEPLASWVDMTVSSENAYITSQVPAPMKKFFGIYDIDLGKNKLILEEPDDVAMDGTTPRKIAKIVIRRKLNEVPRDINDGDLVIEIKREDFGLYKKDYFIDEALSPVLGETWCYKAFIECDSIFINDSYSNEVSVLCKDYYIYGFRIDQIESDPTSMITYIADNTCFNSAYMDYTNDTFNYGGWTVDNGAWFMDVKPCMLKYDGTVDYYLNPNDYSLKEDGTASDIANTAYEGNAMIQFPKVYYKCVNISDDIAEYYFAQRKVDNDYHCWSHIDNNGNEIDYCYMPIYGGCLIDDVLRSISGQTPMRSKSQVNAITYATANNKTDDIIWYTEMFSDRQLVNLLLLLIGKSTNSQAIFGNGSHDNSVLSSGTLNDKGLFYGTNGKDDAVKVFGMENYWGNLFRGVAGWICVKGAYKVKMTYGQSDGSTEDGYNITGDGYIETGYCSCGNRAYIKGMIMTKYGLMPATTGGSATTYYPDIIYVNTSESAGYALMGGTYQYNNFPGIFALSIYRAPSYSATDYSGSISCKPLTQINQGRNSK